MSSLAQTKNTLEAQLALHPDDRQLRLALAEVEEDLAHTSRAQKRLGRKCKPVIYASPLAAWKRDDEGNAAQRREMLETIRHPEACCTSRQAQLVQGLREGKTMKTLADEAGVCKSTVSRTMARAEDRLQRRAQLMMAIQEGELALSGETGWQAFLALLTPHQLRVMGLLLCAELTVSTTAALLGVTPGTVSHLATKGRDRLEQVDVEAVTGGWRLEEHVLRELQAMELCWDWDLGEPRAVTKIRQIEVRDCSGKLREWILMKWSGYQC